VHPLPGRVSCSDAREGIGMPPLKWSTNWDMIIPF
jgi:hypothetical protein